MSEASTSKQASRRQFLKAGGIILLGTAVPKSLTKEPDRAQETPEIQISNLTLIPVITEHDEEAWRQNEAEVTRAIKDSTIVIPEYFPREYALLAENGGVIGMGISSYEEANALFRHVEELCLREGKELWVLDPAYSKAAINLRVTTNVPNPVVAATLGRLGFEAINKALPPGKSTTKGKEKEGTVIVNKLANILSKVVVASVTSMAAGLSLVGENNPIETSVRRVLVAEGLVQLGDLLPPGSRAALIYPQGHWEGVTSEPGIKDYIENEELRGSTLRRAEKLKGLPIFDDLFIVRHYQAEEGKWLTLPGFKR